MSHPDDETLADLALGDDSSATPDQVAHVTGCTRCSAVVPELAQVRTFIATTPEHGSLTRPPSAVWDRIQREVDVLSASEHDRPHLTPVPDASRYADRSPSGLPSAEPVVPHATSPRRATGQVTEAETTRHARHGGRRRWVTAPALWSAAAGIAIGLGTGWAVWDRTDDVAPPAATTVASTQLDTLDTAQVRGQARVLRSSGADSLQVDAEGLDAGDGYLEVWLLNEDGKRMVSLGVLPSEGTTTFPLTASLIDQGYVTVDISREGFDDKPAHSGDSLVRGTLAG